MNKVVRVKTELVRYTIIHQHVSLFGLVFRETAVTHRPQGVIIIVGPQIFIIYYYYT